MLSIFCKALCSNISIITKKAVASDLSSSLAKKILL